MTPELSFSVVDIAPEPYSVVPNLLARLPVWGAGRGNRQPGFCRRFRVVC